jgi:hypothetical protein
LINSAILRPVPRDGIIMFAILAATRQIGHNSAAIFLNKAPPGGGAFRVEIFEFSFNMHAFLTQLGHCQK